ARLCRMEPPPAGAPRGVATKVAASLRAAGRAPQAALVFLGYLAVAVALYAAPMIGELASRSIGVGKGDSKLYVWSLSWLPYALTNGLSPFFTDRVFAPGGADLTWVTTLPAPALVLWPITATFGPLVAYNVLLLLAPALAGWATFLLCRQVTDRFWPSVIGGYLVGFSTYMVGQLHGHANLVLLFPAPLAAYLVLRRYAGTLRPLGFVAVLAGALLFLFGSSTEVFATTTLFGVIAFAGALALFPDRRRIFEVGILVASAYAVVGFVLIPFLLDAFRNVPGAPIRPIDRASTDLFSFVLPRTSTLIGGARFRGVTSRFTASIVEDGGYLGIPLLVAVGLATIAGWRRRAVWFLVGFSALAAILSLGPILHVLGEERWTMPGTWIARLPLLEHATPQRFTAFMAIGVAVVLADWLARAGRDAAWRYGLVAAGALLLLPDLSSPPYHPVIAAPRAITSGDLVRALDGDEVVYAIPERQGEELLWQVEADQAFRLAQGYIGPIPIPYQGIPGSRGLGLDHPNTRLPTPGEFARYLADHDTRTVVVDPAARPLFRVLLEAMGWEGVAVDDLWVYRAGPDAVRPGGAPLVEIDPFVVGRLAPTIALPALDGGAPIGPVPGRSTVVTFVASWCLDGCEDHVEGLRNLIATEPELDLVVVAMGDDPVAARAWFATTGIAARVGLDPDGILFLGTGSARVPTTVVIDGFGIVRRIITTPIDPDAFAASIEAVLGP
ncbi:MAG: hypothetical protein ACKOI0_02195, partial [Actinomycetota bacterium]